MNALVCHISNQPLASGIIEKILLQFIPQIVVISYLIEISILISHVYRQVSTYNRNLALFVFLIKIYPICLVVTYI